MPPTDPQVEIQRRIHHITDNPATAVHEIADAISQLDISKTARQVGDIGSADSALDKARDLLCRILGITDASVEDPYKRECPPDCDHKWNLECVVSCYGGESG